MADADPLLQQTLREAIFAGGKRIRPLLVLLAMRLCRGGAAAESDVGYPLAIAFEYLHAATLIHDDVIDQAAERRGRPSLWRAHGLAAAILAGDWLHARAMHLVGEHAGPRGLAVFCRATRGMVAGEFLQLRYRNDPEQLESQYLNIIAGKTAALVAAACEIGALSAGAPAGVCAALGDYGRHLGLAFQLVDDLLDYQGQETATGKHPGTDWIDGQLTMPLIYALHSGDERVAGELRRLLAGDRASVLSQARESIEQAGGFRYARDLAVQHGELARDALVLEGIAADSPERRLLLALVDFVLGRDR